MAKKKSKKQDLSPPATLDGMQAIFEEMGLPPGDPEAMAMLQQLIKNSGMNLGELFSMMLPTLEEAGVMNDIEEVRPKAKRSSGKSKSSKRKAGGPSDDLDELVEDALSQRSPKTTLEMLGNALKLGEQQLSAEFRDHVGRFWLIVETRPYMRARVALVNFLIAQGQHDDAIGHMEEILRLNPGDNQGVRWLLLEWYCNMNWLDKAWRLLDEYPDEVSPFMAVTRLCLEFQKSGPSEALVSKLQYHLKQNPYIAPKLLSQDEVSPYVVDSFEVGEEEEADAYCQCFRALWKATPEALPWLSSVYRDFAPPEPELTLEDIADLAAEELENAKSFPAKKEIWFCDIDILDKDGHSQNLEINWGSEDCPKEWLMSLVNEATNEAIHISPGEFPLSADSVLCELCQGMSDPDSGQSRRPKIIRLIDAELGQRIRVPLKRLKIDIEIADELPELIQFLRSQRFSPEATPFPLEEILELPQSDQQIWEIDWRTVDTWIPDPETQEPIQPWMILVGAPQDGMIRGQQLSMTVPTENMIARVLAEVILNPMHGEVARPTALIVRQLSNRIELETTAESIGCDVIVDECQLLDHVHQTLTENNVGNTPWFGALIQQPDITADMIGDFFKASAEYYKSRIYTRVKAELTVEISCPALMPKPLVAVTMGQMGQEIGIMFFDNPKSVRAMFKSEHEDPEQNAQMLKGFSYSIDTQDALHPADVAAAEQFGWPVPSSETWPSVYYIEKGEPRPVNAAELRFVTIAMQVTLQMLSGNQKSAKLDIQLHDRTVNVSAKKVSVV